jgi:hypothetical protein
MLIPENQRLVWLKEHCDWKIEVVTIPVSDVDRPLVCATDTRQ